MFDLHYIFRHLTCHFFSFYRSLKFNFCPKIIVDIKILWITTQYTKMPDKKDLHIRVYSSFKLSIPSKLFMYVMPESFPWSECPHNVKVISRFIHNIPYIGIILLIFYLLQKTNEKYCVGKIHILIIYQLSDKLIQCKYKHICCNRFCFASIMYNTLTSVVCIVLTLQWHFGLKSCYFQQKHSIVVNNHFI